MFRKLIYEYSLFSKLGASVYAKLKISTKGSLVVIDVQQTPITIRKGSPDLDVALANLSGEFDCLKLLFEPDYDGVIIDAGGYIGTASIALSTLFPNAKIICMEPSSANNIILKINTEKYENIEVLHKALVGDSSIATIELRDRDTGAWGYTTITHPDDNNSAGAMEIIDCVTLSNIDVDTDKIGIIKLDIEGAEKEIFENDASSIEKIPVIFVELHERISQGCVEAYYTFAKNRWTIKDEGEKYLSLKKTASENT